MRGETLQSAGDPLIEWLRRALEPGGGSVELSGAWLTPAASDPAAPAHAILRTRTSAAVEPVSVLLAESWWAQEFPVPSFPEIRRWLMRSASWVVIGHFVRRLYLRWMAPIIDIVRGVTGWIPWFGATALYEAVVYLIVGAAFAVVTVPFVFFVQFTAGLLSALSFIPMFGIAEWVSSLTRRLASVLGDSYVFTNRHVARAAVVERVSRDLDWLAGQCERVAVVAHSQGAAVSFQALERGVPPQLALWITYGAGIRKLLELEEFQKLAGYVRYAWAFVLAAAIATPLALPGWHAAWRPDSEILWRVLAWTALGLYGAVFIPLVIRDSERAIRKTQARLEARCAALVQKDFHWLDLWATQDPVPAGKLLDPAGAEFGLKNRLVRYLILSLTGPGIDYLMAARYLATGIGFLQTRGHPMLKRARSLGFDLLVPLSSLRKHLLRPPVPGPVSRFVSNRLSPLLDHVTYWDNFDDFVPRVVAALSQDGGLGWPSDDQWVAAKARSRRFRLYQYWTGRLLVFSAFAWAVWSQRWLLFGITSFLLQGPFASVLPRFLTGLGDVFERGLAWLATSLLGFGAAFLYHALFPAAIWSAWDQGVYTRLFNAHGSPWPARFWRLLYWSAALAPWFTWLIFKNSSPI
jgi:hypothetical protein